jgi:protein-arginine kinase activator protein McsA|tara:strand:+ start:647 stop:916 length:270 start_codon:yes stop_codon:yes gene_type:complete
MKACRKCRSRDVTFHKAIYKDNTYHMYLTCEDCFLRYNVSRDAEAYEETKDKPWMKGLDIKRQRQDYARKRKALKKKIKLLKSQSSLFN